MLRLQLLRNATKASSLVCKISRKSPSKSFHVVSGLRTDEKQTSFSRTDSSVKVEYPDEGELPSSTLVQGRGGLHFKRTLASFSLEGKTCIVTGGARGLGLTMTQALITSGADVAIVDLNREII
jgi:D-arabinitol 2-dehydrogenase